MTNPSTELAALWELANEGEAGWWPKVVRYEKAFYYDGDFEKKSVFWYGAEHDSPSGENILDEDDALDLVTANIIRHLQANGMRYAAITPNGNEYHFTEDAWFTSLGEAIGYVEGVKA